MNLRRIIKEELEAESWNNLMDLMKSPDMDNVVLGLQLAPHQDCEEQFKREFDLSIEEYSDLYYNKWSKVTDSKEIVKIIKDNPHLINLFVNKLDEYGICNVLKVQPQLFDKLDVSKLNIYLISDLIKAQPQLLNKFDLNKYYFDLTIYILVYNPSLIESMDTKNWSTSNIARLLTRVPELADKFDLNKLNGIDIIEISEVHPHLLKNIDITKVGDVSRVISVMPELITKVDSSKFSIYDWTIILEKQPQLIKDKNSKKIFDRYDPLFSGNVPYLIEKQPDLLKYFPKDTFDDHHIVNFLINNPKLVGKLNLDRLRAGDVKEILEKQPQLKKYFDKLKKNNINETFERTKTNMFF